MAGDPLQASNAWAMGNVGLSTALRDEDVADAFGDDDAPLPPKSSWWRRTIWRLTRWAFAIGVFLAAINHWPHSH